MQSITMYRSINGASFDQPHEALLEDFKVYRHQLASQVDSFVVCGHSPQRYDELLKDLRAHFKRFTEAGRAYLTEYQAYLQGLPAAPHEKTVYDLAHQAAPHPTAVTEEIAPVATQEAA